MARSILVSCVVLAGAMTGAERAAAQWPAGAGGYWVKGSAFYHRTTTEYRPDGAERPFLNNNAVSESAAFFLDALVGVTDRLDLWVQLPYFDLDFDDDTERRHSEGFGDLRASARVNLLKLRGGSIPVSARLTVKAPLSDIAIDAEVVPLGEGQWDYEAWLESGVSLWPFPAYAVLWAGYRWRTLNTETQRRPGDEIVLLAEFGGTEVLGVLGGKVVVEGVFGRAGVIQRVQLGPDDRRRIVYVAPTVLFTLSSSTILEVAARIPLTGRNFPAGAPLSVGLFHSGFLTN